jgi:hypothetical protein
MRDDDPTCTVNVPVGTTHFWLTTSHTLTSFTRSGIVTSLLCPLCSKLRENPRSTFGGSPYPAGKVR